MSGRETDQVLALIAALEQTGSSVLPGSMPALEDFAEVSDPILAEISASAPSVAPPDDLFDGIEAQIDAPDIPINGVDTIRAAEGDWNERVPGVWKKILANAPDGKNIYFLRCLPGAIIPAHDHGGWEYALVLEGAFEIEGRTVRAGDGQYSAANSRHPEITTQSGCLLLVVA